MHIGILAHDLRNPLNTISVAAGRVLIGSDGIDSKLHTGFRFAIEWPRTPVDQMPTRGESP